MGDVYDVYDVERGMRVALKHLRRVDAMGLYRFKREFRSLSNLSHPNIVALYELIADGPEWYFTMELVEGQDFLSFVRGGRALLAELNQGDTATASHSRDDGDLTPVGLTTQIEVPRGSDPTHSMIAVTATSTVAADRQPARVTEGPALPSPPRHRRSLDQIVDIERLRDGLRQLARALDALHAADMVHRDLKPSNVCVTKEGRVVLVDFGVVAEIRQSADLERHGATIGTPAFMAPEQVRGQARPSAAADWYAFGVLLYLALTERLPYEGPVLQVLDTKCHYDPLPPSRFTDGIPTDLERLCVELLDRDPVRRPAGAEVAGRLRGRRGRVLPSRTEPTLDLRNRPFVGRLGELAELERAFADAREAAAVCALVEGASGMGKSSLVARFLRSLREVRPPGAPPRGLHQAAPRDPFRPPPEGARARPVVLSGRCHEREELPYKAFDGVVDNLIGVLVEMDGDQRKAVLPADVGVLERLFPVLRRLAAGAGERAGKSRGKGPLELRRRAFAALRALLAGLARERPVVVHIEDLQWADVDSLELLLALLARPAPAGLMVVATIRTEVGFGAGARDGARARAAALFDSLVEADACRRIRLGRLSDAEQHELLTRLVHRPEVLGNLDDGLVQGAVGNPMLLVELARHLQEAPNDHLAQDTLGVEDILWRRVNRLPAPALALMEVVAVAGTPVPLRVLGAAIGQSGADSERAAALLRIGQLVRTSQSGADPWLSAYHDKVREAITGHLDEARIGALHRALAEALERWGKAPAAIMADHWRGAGEPARAAGYCVQAAREAMHQLAFDRADDLYHRALHILPPASTEPSQARLRCQAWLGLAEGMRVRDRTEEALGLLDRAQPLATEHDLADVLATLYSLRGNLLFPRGDLDGCQAAHEMALRFAERAGSPEREAQALSGLGDAQYMRGRMISAYQHFHRCIELCRAHNLVDIEVANLGMRGMTRYYQSDLGAALRDSTDAATAAAWIGHQRAEIVARNGCVGWILTEMGRVAEARREFESALDLARALGARRFEPNSLTWLAKIAGLEGRHDEAVALARESVAICRETGFAFVGPMALGALVRVTRDPDERARAIAEAEAALAGGSASHNVLYFYRDAIDALLVAGDPDGVERMADALSAYTSDEPLPWSRFFIDRARALSAHLRGQGDRGQLTCLRDEARVVGFALAAAALDEALADDPGRAGTAPVSGS